MKKIIASAGMLVAGVAGLNAENLGDLSPELASKRWHASAALRGFYDDNYDYQPPGSSRKGSGGIQFTPEASINLPMDRTYLSASYIGSLRYFFDRPDNDFDHSHTLDLKADHKFSERHRLRVQDTFVYSQEPAIIDQGGPITTPGGIITITDFQRVDIGAVRNLLPIEFDWQLSPLFGLSLGYQNTYYNYLDDGDGSYSAKLDRLEHLFRADVVYQLSEHSRALLGYQFGIVNYTSDERLAPSRLSDPTDPTSPLVLALKASSRDNLSHYLYVGYEQEFASHLSLAVRLGGVYTDYELGDNELTPYADLSLSYQYLPGNTLKIGLKQQHNSTDQTGEAFDEESLVRDQNSTTIYGTVTHRVTPKLTANGSVQYQHSIYNGGDLDGTADDYIQLAFILAYRFTRNWSAEVEYDFYTLLSDDETRDFTRNVVYGGVRFTF